jgi:hypothetical protein
LMFQTLMSSCECAFPVSLQNNNSNNNKLHEITLCPFFPSQTLLQIFQTFKRKFSPISPYLMVEYSCVTSATVLRPHSLCEPLQDSTYVQYNCTIKPIHFSLFGPCCSVQETCMNNESSLPHSF